MNATNVTLIVAGIARKRFRVCWRPLRQGELDHELIWVCVSLVSAIGLLLWLKLRLPLPLCPFHAITGFPCLTCGATRCFIQLSQGHLGAAIRWNPGAFAALSALTIYNAYGIIVVALNLPRLRIATLPPGTAVALRMAAFALAALNWIYLLIYLPKWE